jgi:hypothetical protein
MGIDIRAARFLRAARSEGVSFAKTLTLGRQWLLLAEFQMRTIFSGLGKTAPAKSEVTYADSFFEALGATELISMDASKYEDAQIIHDLNQPIPNSLKGQFDVVFDGGTTEHVFNYPQALKNAMEMVKVGGRLMMYQPMNNWCGHGFYQVSPELIFRCLSEANGFKVEHFYASSGERWYEVADPETVQERVELTRETTTVFLLVQARRLEEKAVFTQTPQQSDYVAKWQSDGKLKKNAFGKWIDTHVSEKFGGQLRAGRNWLRSRLDHRGTLNYRKHFRPVRTPQG